MLRWAYAAHLPDNVAHRHTYFEVCLVGSWGAGEFRLEGKLFPIGPGDLFVARPGVVHQIVNTRAPEMELFWVAFHWERQRAESGESEALLDRFANAAEVWVQPDSDGRIGALWRTLRTIAEKPRRGDEAQIAPLTAALLAAIAQAGSELEPEAEMDAEAGSRRESYCAPARLGVRYIQDNLSHRALTVAEVAAHLGVSPRHLIRLFHEFTGVAPAAYIEQARIERARTLLLHTAEPIKQIALRTGYADVYHFTRVFRRVTGCPPGVYRASCGATEARPSGANIPNPGTIV